jgi:predicted ATPase
LCRRFDLRAISRQTADHLIEALLPGGKPSQSLLDLVYELTVGNPLFIQELVLSLKDRDELILFDGHWFAPEAIVVPEKIRDLVRVRVDAKTEFARQVLALAATAGNEFSYDYLRTAAARALRPAVTEGNLLDVLDDALQTGILEERDDSYSFRYPVYRAALSEHLSDHRRAHFREVLVQIASQTG